MLMIAIGGSVGTGLFIASGAIIPQAGPAGKVRVWHTADLWHKRCLDEQ
ncbi:MAG TPA: hypothetical protein DCS81_13425 [Pantoea septica]|nr:hypothetical protein [Pantoea septica]HAT25249.1 hypothetical protein [Pantoea septica]